MLKLSLPENPDLVSVLSEIKKSAEGEVVLLLPLKPSQWDVLALKTLACKLNEWGKKIEFKAQNKEGENLLSFFKGEKKEKKEEKKKRIKPNWRRAPVIGGIAIVLSTGIVATYVLLPKATLNLKVNSSPLVKIIEVTADSTATALDPQNRILPAIKVSVEQEGNFEGEATGEKEVGNIAKGKITIYNRTEKSMKISGDEELTSEDESLSFVLDADEDIKINAAESTEIGGEDIKITPSVATVSARASKIGNHYNIKQNTRLTFANFKKIKDNFYAKVAESFSGGDSRIVKTVQAGDQESLLSQAVEKLTSKCTEGLSGKLVGDQTLEKTTVKSHAAVKQFSPALGEETEKVQLNLKIACEGLAYSTEQLNELLASVLHDLVPEGFSLSSGSQEVQILTAEEAPEGLQPGPRPGEASGPEGFVFQTRIEGQVVQEIDIEKIKEAIRGRTFADAKTYLTTLPYVNSYKISFWPPLPGALRRFPFQKERIGVKLDYN